MKTLNCGIEVFAPYTSSEDWTFDLASKVFYEIIGIPKTYFFFSELLHPQRDRGRPGDASRAVEEAHFPDGQCQAGEIRRDPVFHVWGALFKRAFGQPSEEAKLFADYD